MIRFSPEIWTMLALLALGGITAVLHIIAQQYGEERKMFELRVRVRELRKVYAARLAEISGKSTEEIVSQFKEKPIQPHADKKAA